MHRTVHTPYVDCWMHKIYGIVQIGFCFLLHSRMPRLLLKTFHMYYTLNMACMLQCVCVFLEFCFVRKPFTVTSPIGSSYEANFNVGRLTGTWRTFILSFLYRVMPWPPVKLVFIVDNTVLASELHDILFTLLEWQFANFLYKSTRSVATRFS